MADILTTIQPKGWRDDAMEDLWAIKEQLWAEVANLPLEEALAARARQSNATVEALGLAHLVSKPAEEAPDR